MKKIKKIGIIVLFIVVFGFVLVVAFETKKEHIPLLSNSENRQSNQILYSHVYKNTLYHFSIHYPPRTMIIEDTQTIRASGYIPACDPDTSAVCVLFPKETFPGSNFTNAAVSTNILPATTTEPECLTAMNGERVKNPTIIGAVPFQVYGFSDGALSHQSEGYNYRVFKNNRCVELTTRINTTTFEVYEPGTISRFTDTQRNELEQTLQNIVASFRFVD